MSISRRRRLAWLFLLVLTAELAVLCCASAHCVHHLCTGHETCAICACVRASHRRALSPLLLAAILALAATALSIRSMPRAFCRGGSLFARHVRLND